MHLRRANSTTSHDCDDNDCEHDEDDDNGGDDDVDGGVYHHINDGDDDYDDVESCAYNDNYNISFLIHE
jgi:hypothetical protein